MAKQPATPSSDKTQPLHPALAPTDGPAFFGEPGSGASADGPSDTPPDGLPQPGHPVSNVPSPTTPGGAVLPQSSVQHMEGTPGGENPPTLDDPGPPARNAADAGRGFEDRRSGIGLEATDEQRRAASEAAQKTYEAELAKHQRVASGRRSSIQMEQRGWLVVEPITYSGVDGKRANAKPSADPARPTVIEDLSDADIVMFKNCGAIKEHMVMKGGG